VPFSTPSRKKDYFFLAAFLAAFFAAGFFFAAAFLAGFFLAAAFFAGFLAAFFAAGFFFAAAFLAGFFLAAFFTAFFAAGFFFAAAFLAGFLAAFFAAGFFFAAAFLAGFLAAFFAAFFFAAFFAGAAAAGGVIVIMSSMDVSPKGLLPRHTLQTVSASLRSRVADTTLRSVARSLILIFPINNSSETFMNPRYCNVLFFANNFYCAYFAQSAVTLHHATPSTVMMSRNVARHHIVITRSDANKLSISSRSRMR
jgi:MFS family permease